MAFDARVSMEDGAVRKVRTSQFSAPDHAVDFTGDTADLTIELTVL